MSPPPSKSGVLIVDKPKGPTSHDLVAQARRLYRTRRVGHAGTLDPMATGVLVLLFGEATKLSSVLTRERKSYVTRIRFGAGTVAHDADSPIVKRQSLAPDWLLEQGEKLEAALASERERALQLPPAVSALKVDGRRAHALTRAGAEPELEPRDVSVHELRVLEVAGLELELELSVSKGYYVRALARDLGLALGAPAHLIELRRTRSGAFPLSEAVRLAGAPAPLLSVVEAARRSLFAVELTPIETERARQGKLLLIGPDRVPEPPPEELLGTHGDDLVALLEPLSPSDARAARVFLEEPPGPEAIFRVKRGFRPGDPLAEGGADE